MRAALALLALCFAGCTPPRVPLDPTDARACVLELASAVHVAAQVCTAVAQYLQRVDEEPRSQRLAEACTRHLIPAHDAVIFGAAEVDPWKPGSESVAGCTGKAVRVGLDGVVKDLREAGYVGRLPALVDDGRKLGARLEPYATASCDPRSPTTKVTTWVDPTIARPEEW